MRALMGWMLLLSLLPIISAEDIYTPGKEIKKTFKGFGLDFIDQYCLDCHDDGTEKGNLSLEHIKDIDETNAALWKSIWAQVSLGEMPPPKKKNQPEVSERLIFSDWIVQSLSNAMADKGGFEAHLDPKKGNFLDHSLLFGPLPKNIQLEPTSSPARIWRLTREEHITRLNELINTEAQYDPKKPGLRTRGDVVPTNHGGELKLYFGTDRIIRWQGGTVAYATAVKSVPAVLSSARHHGLQNYPHFYSVNSSESTQILAKGSDIIRYMMEGPLSLVTYPEQISSGNQINYEFEGDIRGQPSAIIYNDKVVRPLTPVYDLMQREGISDNLLIAAVEYMFEALTFRPPIQEETHQYLDIVKDSIKRLGKKEGLVMGLSAIFLDRDALFRSELGKGESVDQHGRVMLQDWELGLALNHALSYIEPDAELKNAILLGKMKTKEDVRRELQRMLADESIRKPRVIQFFRDYFDYDLAGYICKDSNALKATGVGTRETGHYKAMFAATASTDRLIEEILREDRDVLRQLLTTDKVVATKIDQKYFGRMRTKEEIKAALKAKKKLNQELTEKENHKLKGLERELKELKLKSQDQPKDKELTKLLSIKEKAFKNEKKKIEQARKRRKRGNSGPMIEQANLEGPDIYARVSRRSFGKGSMRPERIMAKAPKGERLGLLTHPSWLVSHSDAMDNHAIHRGIWVRTKLLGGGIPDVPITVDAMLPDEPMATLRQRMRVTRGKSCWPCHQKMDPLGLPFEMYNHAGVYRTLEKGEPVDTSGEIIRSGDPNLDGPVDNAIDMIRKIVASERTEQVFVRHAFRFWMGRNETLNDRSVLQEAHRAYRESGGSMKALLISLMTSDAFVYRKVKTEPL